MNQFNVVNDLGLFDKNPLRRFQPKKTIWKIFVLCISEAVHETFCFFLLSVFCILAVCLHCLVLPLECAPRVRFSVRIPAVRERE